MLNEDQKEYVVTKIIKNKMNINKLEDKIFRKAMGLSIVAGLVTINTNLMHFAPNDTVFKIEYYASLIGYIGAGSIVLSACVNLAKKARINIDLKKCEEVLSIDKLEGGKSK